MRTTGTGHFEGKTTASGTFGLKVDGASNRNDAYLAVQGSNDFQGLSAVDWPGYEIAVAGISRDTVSSSDNYGVLGNSNHVGVRGENGSSYGELGLLGVGLRASGFNLAADLLGDVGVDGMLDVTNNLIALRATGIWAAELNGILDVDGTVDVQAGGGGIPLLNLSRNVAASSSWDILQIQDWSSSSVASQYIECEGTDIDFRVDRSGQVFADGSFNAFGADYAEMIEVSSGAVSVEPGDVLVVDPTGERAVKLSDAPYSRLVAGVYSTRPGVVGSEREWDAPDPAGGDEPLALRYADMAERHDEVPMALVGIVPCKVSGEGGPIAPGDLLVTSSLPGHAMAAFDPPVGSVLGKALEPFEGSTGVIRVLVTLQ